MLEKKKSVYPLCAVFSLNSTLVVALKGTLSVENPQWRSVHAPCILSHAPFVAPVFRPLSLGLDACLYLDTQPL